MRWIPSKATVLEAIEKWGTQRNAARQLGVHKDVIWKVINNKYTPELMAILEEGDAMLTGNNEAKPYDGESVEMAAQLDNIRSFDDLFKFFGVSADEWEVADGAVLNVWDGKPQIKAKLRRKLVSKGDLSDLLQEIRDSSDKLWVPPLKKDYGDHVDVYCLSDVHLGKLAEVELTGTEQTLELSESWVRRTLLALLARAEGGQHAVLPIGNDFLHVDTVLGTTTSGTRVESNASIFRSFKWGRKILHEMVNTLLTRYEKVTVVPVRGNHDSMMTAALAEVMDATFHNTDRVHVVTSPRHRQYIQHGANLLGFTHGRKDKPERLASLMATECEKLGLYAGTLNRWWFLGHLHKYEATEVNGTVICRVRSLCADDLWHDEELFSGNGKAGEVFRFSHDGSSVERFMAMVTL